MDKILIYSQRAHPRICFVWDFLASCFNDLEYEITTDLESYLRYEGLCISLNEKNKARELSMPVHPHFWEDVWSIRPESITVHKEALALFYSKDGGESYDAITMIFWFLSRMEEYYLPEKDPHQRFDSSQSIIIKYHLEKFPWVDMFADHIIEKINSTFSVHITRKILAPSLIVGFDIDAWTKYKHKAWWKNGLGLIRDFIAANFAACNQRIAVMTKTKDDPYEQLSLIGQLKLAKEQVYFFILSGGHSIFDKRDLPDRKYLQLQIDNLKNIGKIGIHPSYYASENAEELSQQIESLEEITGDVIQYSRQHYLRIIWPTSYQLLHQHKIYNDFSLCYPDRIGFRAGTCHPFFWYNIHEEKQTNLKIYPAVAMDRSLQQYLKWTPEQATSELENLYQRCQKHGGIFQIIWHNTSFDECSEWKAWVTFLPQFLERIK